MALYIGIDLGTSGCRACALDENRQIVHICSRNWPAPLTEKNALEQDARLWWQEVEQLLSELCQQIDATQVAAIAVDGTSGTVLVTDEKGEPLAPALMYNDNRAIEQARHIARHAPENSPASGAGSGLARLLWLYEHNPVASHALHQADWVLGKLSGRFNISDENNALKTGYDPVKREWPGWINSLGIRHLLPEAIPPGTDIGCLTDSICQQFGLARTTRVISGTTDSIAAFLATGASQPGEAVTSLGSTLVLKIICEQPVFNADYGIYSHRLGNYWLAGGASNSGGTVLKQFFTNQQMQDMTSQLQPEQTTGLDYYPLLKKGERFPQSDPELQPKLEPRPEQPVVFFQAMLEGIARIEHKGYQKLHELGTPYPVNIRTAGGGSVNLAWRRIRQDITGVNITTADNTEACVGTALLAMQAV